MIGFKGAHKDVQEISHEEISKFSHLGPITSTLLGCNSTQGPRLSYQTTMTCNSAVGTIPVYYGATETTRLTYGQHPLVQTQASKDFGMGDMGTCANMMVAIAPHRSSVEDAVTISKAALDMGLFKCYRERTFMLRVDPSGDDRFCAPDHHDTVGITDGNYGKLNNKGVPEIGTKVEVGDVLIGHCKPRVGANFRRGGKNSGLRKYQDASLHYKDATAGVVTNTVIVDGIRRVTVLTQVPLRLGDKITMAHHGQKATVGHIEMRENMPYMPDGTPITAILPPQGMPSRMTQGVLREIGMTTARAAGCGPSIDVQDYGTNELDRVQTVLHDNGLDSFVTSTLICGKSGHLIGYNLPEGPTKFTVGMIPYAVLDYRAWKKSHCRAEGPLTECRQPTEGRSNQGGHRVSTLMAGACITHGAMRLLDSTFRGL